MESSRPKVLATVTLPSYLRDRLDGEAARQERSRSFLTAQAIKEYLAKREAAANDHG